MRRWVKGAVAGVIGLGVIGAGITWYALRGGESGAVFRTATVKRGDLVVTISATGTVVPEEVIDVGAQIAGQIVSFGRDAAGRTVDYGSAVDEGTVLAKIDDSLYAADAAQAEAQVQSGKAALQRAEADLGQLRAKLHQAERDWQRAQKLGPSEALAEATFDAYRSAYETAVANLAVGQAAILQSRASLAQSEALFRRAQRNLGYTTIKSPVKGVIIDRRVNIGQTVVASLNAPSLFLIAKDLKRMQVWVAVNEADIGRIRPGLPVTFSVDSFPGETFRGEVGKVRLNASMTQNVVTYTVEVVTDNSSGRLLPYLTANVQFELDRRADVFQAPNAALRFRPTPEQIAPEFRDAVASAAEGRARAKTGGRPGQGQTGEAGAQAARASLWLPEGGHVRPLAVKVGLSDSTMTEVAGEGLADGLEVVTGVQTETGARPETSNPFTPSFQRGGGGGPAGAGRPR
jgi:HlyD family secretion protein